MSNDKTSVRSVEPDITNLKKIIVKMSCGADFANILFVREFSWINTIGIYIFESQHTTVIINIGDRSKL